LPSDDLLSTLLNAGETYRNREFKFQLSGSITQGPSPLKGPECSDTIINKIIGLLTES